MHTHTHREKNPQTHIQTHTQAASPHLRNVTGLLLHSKPTGALNKHLFLPVNPPASAMLLTRLSQGTQHPLVSALFSSAPLALLFSVAIPPPLKGIYTLTFGIQIKKRGQGEAERITEAYECDSCFTHTHVHTVTHTYTNTSTVTLKVIVLLEVLLAGPAW